MSRLLDFFVAAAAEPAPVFAPPRARAGTVAVLAPAGVLAVAAGAAAAELRRADGAPVALVCLWGAAAAGAPARPAAGRLAADLCRRELPARAVGALCVVALPADAEAATATARRAALAAAVPAVLAVARRDGGWDPLLRGVDELRLAIAPGMDPLLCELAAASLRRLGPPVRALELPHAVPARLAARLGFAPAAPPARAGGRAAAPAEGGAGG